MPIQTLRADASDAPLDVLGLAAHPDDVELCAGGTMCVLGEQGYRTGIVDLTRGEMGTRGTPEGRMDEATAAAEVLGLVCRYNLGLADGHIPNTPESRRDLIRLVRRHRPRIVLMNAPHPHTRHPDHGDAARMQADALFYGGLAKLETTDPDTGEAQEPWRPHHALHYLQALDFEATFVVDVSGVWERRVRALRAFKSQFHNPDYDGDEPETYVSNAGFFDWIEGRARTWGYRIGATYGEPLAYRHGPVGVTDLVGVLGRERPFR